MTDTVEFNSCGDVCKGVLTRPGGKSDNVPLVIMAGGWCYTKEIVMPWYGKFFEDLGCATLRFDYRRFGESTGEPRQHLNPWDQIEDYRNALTFAETLSGIDKKRTGIWGISYSGGHVLVTAALIHAQHSQFQRFRWSMDTRPCDACTGKRDLHN